MSGTLQSTSVKVISNSNKSALYKTYNIITSVDIVRNILNWNNWLNTKWWQGKLYVNWNLILDMDNRSNDLYKHVCTQHKNHSFMTSKFFDDVSPFVNIFDSEKIDANWYDGWLRGMMFDNSGNEIMLNHQFNTGNATYTHYIFVVILKAFYFLNGEVSLVPFVN